MGTEGQIEWTAEYSVGHAILDAQHRKLLALCRRAAESMEDSSPEGISAFHDILNDLTHYVREHFQTEEALLERCRYADLAEHRAKHVHYEEKLGDFLIDAITGAIDKASFSDYLTRWWLDHILRSDRAYSASLTAHTA